MAMSILQEIENQVAALMPAEKAELLHSVARVVCTSDDNFVALASRIHDKLTETGAIEGQLIRINRPRA